MRSLLTLKVSIWFKSCWWRIIHRRSSSTSAKTNCSTKTGRWLRPKGSSGWLSPTTASSTRVAPTSSSWAGWSRPTGRTSAPRRKCRKITQPSRAARVCPSTLARASAWSQARWAQINRTMRSLWSVGRDVSWCVHLQEKAVRPSTRKHGTSFLIDSICEGHKVKRHLMNGNWMFSCKCSSITFVCRLSPEVSERICPCHLNISVFTPMEKGDRLFKCNKSKSCSNLRLR